MRGGVRGRGGEAEAVVRERLRSILAAAAPCGGWVPERVTERARPAEPDMPGDSDAWESGEPDEALDQFDQGPESASEAPSSEAAGRHREATGSHSRLRWDPGRPGAVAMCVVAVLAALLAAGLTWWSRPQAAGGDRTGMQSVVASTDTAAQGMAAPPDGSGSASSSPAEGGPGPVQDQLVVSVIGQVHQPGLVTVADGARVADAITAAGGALPEADLSTVNLARLLVDGEQIAVGVPGSALPGGSDRSSAGDLVDLNSADRAELEELPGIGPVLAERILDFREENAGFTNVEQLREVSGIGPTVYEDIVDLVTV